MCDCREGMDHWIFGTAADTNDVDDSPENRFRVLRTTGMQIAFANLHQIGKVQEIVVEVSLAKQNV